MFQFTFQNQHHFLNKINLIATSLPKAWFLFMQLWTGVTHSQEGVLTGTFSVWGCLDVQFVEVGYLFVFSVLLTHWYLEWRLNYIITRARRHRVLKWARFSPSSFIALKSSVHARAGRIMGSSGIWNVRHLKCHAMSIFILSCFQLSIYITKCFSVKDTSRCGPWIDL